MPAITFVEPVSLNLHELFVRILVAMAPAPPHGPSSLRDNNQYKRHCERRAVDILTGPSGEAFETVTRTSHKPVIVLCWAEWCKPCGPLAATLAEITEECPDEFLMAELDTEAHEIIARKYVILSLPMLMVFDKGEVVLMSVGNVDKKFLLRSIRAALSDQGGA